MELGDQKRELSHTCHLTYTLPQLEERYFISRTGRVTTLLPQQEEGDSFLPVIAQPMEDGHKSTKKSHYTSNIQFSPVYSSFITAPSKSIKKCSFPLPVWTYAWFAIRLHVPNYNFQMFPNKHILLEKYLASCLRSTLYLCIYIIHIQCIKQELNKIFIPLVLC